MAYVEICLPFLYYLAFRAPCCIWEDTADAGKDGTSEPEALRLVFIVAAGMRTDDVKESAELVNRRSCVLAVSPAGKMSEYRQSIQHLGFIFVRVIGYDDIVQTIGIKWHDQKGVEKTVDLISTDGLPVKEKRTVPLMSLPLPASAVFSKIQ